MARDGVVRFSDLSLRAPAVRITGGDGFYNPDGRLALNAQGVTDAYGRVGVRVAGTLSNPNAFVTAERPDLGIGLANLEARITGAGAGYRLNATADTDYGALTADVVLGTGEQLSLDIQSANLAGIDFSGSLRQTAAGPFAGRLDADGRGLAGVVRLDNAGGFQEALVNLRARDTVLDEGPIQLTVAAAAVLALLGIAVVWRGWQDILAIAWNDRENSQVLLVPIVFVWLVMTWRERMAGWVPRASLWGPAIIAAGWGLFEIGFYQRVSAAFHLGAVLVPVGAAVAILGSGMVVRLWPAFLVLLFMVPVPGGIRTTLALPLQQYSAAISEAVLVTLGADISRSGNVLLYNGREIGVAEACNGMQMVFALLLVIYVFAFSTPLKWYMRLLVLLVSPWLRWCAT